MHRIWRRTPAALYLLPLAAFAWARQDSAPAEPPEPPTIKVTGVVLDTDGKPVEDVQVGSYWELDSGQLKPGAGAAVSDRSGRFAVEAPGWMPMVPVLALGKDARGGAFQLVAKADAERPLELKLAPLGRLRARLDTSALPKPPGERKEVPGSLGIVLPPTNIPLAYGSAGTTELELQLPAGRYALNVFRLDCVPMDQAFDIESGKEAAVEMKLEPTKISQMTGKEPPAWTALDARGLAKDATLASLRGKWVLLEFWGFW